MAHLFVCVGVLGFLLRPALLADEKATPLDALLKARQETLGKLLETQVETFRAGRSGMVALADTSRRLRDAEIERTVNPADRLAAHDRHVKQMREFEKVVETRFEAGRVALLGLAEAKRQRLEAELAQVRERLLHSPTAEDIAREKSLYDERREVLQMILKARMHQFEAGLGMLDAFLEVSRLVLDAELEFTSKKAERLALHERHLKLVGQCVETTETMFKAGRIALFDVLVAKTSHIEDRIRHLREQAGDSPMAEDAARIRKLQVECRDLARDQLKALEEELARGNRRRLESDAPHLLLLRAELALAEKQEERLAIHHRHLGAMKEWERIQEQHYQNGRRSLSELLERRAARLDAEIGLMRAGGKIDK